MELYATGFNAWNQLRFDAVGDDEPDDVFSFTCALRDESISRPRPLLSCTTVRTSAGTRLAGAPSKAQRELLADGRLAHAELVEASNDAVVVLDDGGKVAQYKSLSGLVSRSEKPAEFSHPSRATQIVAYETGFAALSSRAQVWTWGDERYSACLGREVTPESPADRPGLVTELENLPTGPITKIAGGGYLLAALTAGNDLYCWGGHPARPAFLDGIPSEPTPVVVEEHDIADVGVGDAHMIALTVHGQVFVIGDNGSGQLGLGRACKSVAAWTKPSLPVDQSTKITGIAAGPRSSLILVQRMA